jgi:DNA mismatch endonuclease (patch repair protein)
MADHVCKTKRSEIMRSVGSRDTKPEMAVRKMIHAMGYRFRLNIATLPGKPDLVFPRLHKVIFVHGCFWHRHNSCHYATMPKTHIEFWADKFLANVQRDRRIVRALKKQGWAVKTVWQCELKNAERLAGRINEFLAE